WFRTSTTIPRSKIQSAGKNNFSIATKPRNTPNGKMKTRVYYAGKLLVRFVFGCVARIHIIGRENARYADGFLLASNHISHFDPFLISLPLRRKIDWMTMAEFFRPPPLGFLLRTIDAFPAERDRADLKTIRTAIDRLKTGRIVGLFP